jgi:hypothetical protein
MLHSMFPSLANLVTTADEQRLELLGEEGKDILDFLSMELIVGDC